MLSPDEIDFSELCLRRENTRRSAQQQLLSNPSNLYSQDSKLINRFRPSQDVPLTGFTLETSNQGGQFAGQNTLNNLSQMQRQHMSNEQQPLTNSNKSSCNGQPLKQTDTHPINVIHSPNSHQNYKHTIPQTDQNSSLFRHRQISQHSPNTQKGNAFATASWPKSHQAQEIRKPAPQTDIVSNTCSRGESPIARSKNLQNMESIQAFEERRNQFPGEQNMESPNHHHQIEILRTEASRLLSGGESIFIIKS